MTKDEIAAYRARLRASGVPEEDHEEFLEDEATARYRRAVREMLEAAVVDGAEAQTAMQAAVQRALGK